MNLSGNTLSKSIFPFFLRKGSVESTHKVPTSHYHTKHCHATTLLDIVHIPRITDLHTPSHSGTRAHHRAAISAAVVLADAQTIHCTGYFSPHSP